MKQTDRRTFLIATGAAAATFGLAGCADDEEPVDGGDAGGDDDDDGTDVDGFEIDPGTTVLLEGYASGWEGLEPAAIEGETNPTLVLEEGAEYTFEWVNGDGALHDLQIRDDGDDVVDDLETDQVSGDDSGDSLTFTATPEMVTYICSVHPTQQLGDIVVE